LKLGLNKFKIQSTTTYLVGGLDRELKNHQNNFKLMIIYVFIGFYGIFLKVTSEEEMWGSKKIEYRIGFDELALASFMAKNEAWKFGNR